MTTSKDVTEADVDISHFPLIASALKGRVLQRFQEALSHFASGIRMGAIPNVVYSEAKENINRAISEAHEELVSKPSFHGGAGNDIPFEVTDVVYYNKPQMHTLAGKLKKVEKLNYEHPAVDVFCKLIREAMPLAHANDALKAKIVKRMPKPAEERKEAFVPKLASNETVKRVADLLNGITQSKHDELVAAFVDYATRVVSSYLTAQADADRPVDPHDYFRKRKDPTGYFIAQRCVKFESRHGHPPTITRLPDADETIHKLAVGNADQIRDKFVYKNLRKLASIVDAKGNLHEGAVLFADVTQHGMLGRLRFTFSDGAAFTVQNSVVLSYSIYDRPFFRFPLTFHDVKMPDGSPMKQPSEERMNTLFAGRYYGTIAAPESERTMLESLGIRLGAYDEARGVFPAEVPHDAKEKLDEFSSDFKADLLLRSFEAIEDMSPEGLAAELAWHQWAESLNDTAIYARMHVPLTELGAKIEENAKQAAMNQAFGPASAKPAGGPEMH